jgi:hypothetical protein
VKKFSEELYQKFIRELSEAAEAEQEGVKKLVACLLLIRHYLEVLKQYALENPFESQAAEIECFKVIKPLFYRWLIYYTECYTIERGQPLEGGEALLKYYSDQLKYVNRFFRQHEFHYQYYKLNAVELDHLYFIRGAALQVGMAPEVPEVDPSFGTRQDYLFSKFMAFELLQAYLLEKMDAAKGNTPRPAMISKKGRETRWTGDTCNLIEVVYGIFDTKQVNEGEVDLSDLIDVFEQCFQVNLSRYFRRFTEIKRRKAMSKTRYLDEMRAAVSKRIEDGDAFDAARRKQERERNRW